MSIKNNRTMVNNVIEKIKEETKMTKNFTETGMKTHKIVMATGQGEKHPVISLSGALNKHNAVMFKIETDLPSPIFVNIQSNFMKKNAPEQVAKTDKLFHIEESLSDYNYEHLLNLYRKAVTDSSIDAVAEMARKNTGYIFIGELLHSFEILENEMKLNLEEAGKKITSLEKDETKAADLPQAELDILKLMAPEGVETDDIIQITKWVSLEVPEGATVPVYSIGTYKRAHWENFSLSMFAPYERKNCFWKATYTNLDNNSDQTTEEAVKLTKEIRELKNELNK